MEDTEIVGLYRARDQRAVHAPYTQTERNMGIELFRIVAMYMVVVLHMLLPILGQMERGTGTYELSWLAECAAYCAVNCFGLISGYVGAGRSVSVGKAAGLWLQTAFYSLGFTLLGLAIRSDVAGDPLLWAAFPLISGQYWYMTAYFGVMLLMPLLEAGVLVLPLRVQRLTALGVLALSVTGTFFTPQTASMSLNRIFALGGGYSVIWLALLYVVGGYLRRSELLRKLKKRWAALVYFLCLAVTWTGVLRDDRRWLSYTSPTVLLEGAALVLLFSKLELRARPLRRAVEVMAPAALGVYLIHISPWLYRAVTSRLTLTFPAYGGVLCVTLVLLTALGVYLASTALELVRIRLFKLLRVPRLTAAIDRLVRRTG